MSAYIFDLDGLVLDTETLCIDVASEVLRRYGATLTHEAQKAALGKRPLDCWRDVARVLGLQVEATQLLNESEAVLSQLWGDARMLPGALRLLQHVRAAGRPAAIATSTPRSTFLKKTATKPFLQSLVDVVVCGDEVENGKPAPDVFLEAARQLGVAPADCFVFEDAPSGVNGALAAGMRVVIVPSLADKSEYPQPGARHPAAAGGAAAGPGAQADVNADAKAGGGSAGGVVVALLPSLLALAPADIGLPPFEDLIPGGSEAVIPIDRTIYLKGTVVKGFGRGSKDLGIPTANVDSAALHATLAQAVTGIYAGWASIGPSAQVYKMCMSIGYNPFFADKEKTAEPWILHTFDQPFYGQEIRLVICAYLRPEANFTTLENLIARIRLDGDVSAAALCDERLQTYSRDAFLQPSEVATAASS